MGGCDGGIWGGEVRVFEGGLLEGVTSDRECEGFRSLGIGVCCFLSRHDSFIYFLVRNGYLFRGM